MKLNLKIRNAVPSDFETVEVSFDENLDESSESRMSVDEQIELSIRRISSLPFGVLSANQFNADG